jgi:hypothetical protein
MRWIRVISGLLSGPGVVPAQAADLADTADAVLHGHFLSCHWFRDQVQLLCRLRRRILRIRRMRFFMVISSLVIGSFGIRPSWYAGSSGGSCGYGGCGSSWSFPLLFLVRDQDQPACRLKRRILRMRRMRFFIVVSSLA